MLADLEWTDKRGHVTCAECRRRVTNDEAEREGWRYWSDGLGELHPTVPTKTRRGGLSASTIFSSAGSDMVRGLNTSDYQGKRPKC